MPAKTENGYMGNPNLRSARSTRQYTEKEMQELFKCSQDIIHFAENYCTIITLDGKETIKLYDYQKELLEIMNNGKPEEDKYNSIVLSPRQSGKCLTGDSIITVKNTNTGIARDITLKEFHDEM